MTTSHLTEDDYTKTFPTALDQFPTVEDLAHYIDAWELNSLFSSIKTTQQYLLDHKAAIEATVKDSFSGAAGVKAIAIPAGRYPSGKTCTAIDADLIAGNIKKDVIIFGVTGSLTATISGREMVFGPKIAGDDCFLSGTSFNSTGAYLSLGNRSGGDRHCSIRMPDCSIAPGSTITEAFLRMATEYAGAQATCNLKIHFNAVDNAVAPTTTAEFSALSLDDGVDWDAVEGWVTGVFYDTPSIVTTLQAVIDRSGWASGNAIQVLIKNNGSSYDARRTPASVEWAYGQKRVELHAKWTEP